MIWLVDPFSIITPFLPYQSLFDYFLIVTPEQVNPNFFETIVNNLGLLTGFISSVGIVGGIMITVGVWLRRTVTKENKEIRESTKRALEESRKETQDQILNNRSQIDNVKTTLENKIDNVAVSISSKLSDHKEMFGEIKHTMEKISDKLESNTKENTANMTRLSMQEREMDKIHHKMSAPDGYDDTLRRLRRKNNIDNRYSLEATEGEVEDDNRQEVVDEASKNREMQRRKDIPDS